MALAALIVAIAAAAIALLSFGWSIGWSIYQHRQLTRGNLHVTAALSFLTGYSATTYSISATNQGSVPVTLSGAVIEIPGVSGTIFILQWVLQDPGPLPHLLTPGASWMGIADADDIYKAVGSRMSGRGKPWKVRVGVKDAAGKVYAVRTTLS